MYYLVHGNVERSGTNQRYYPNYCIIKQDGHTLSYASMKRSKAGYPAQQWFHSPYELKLYSVEKDFHDVVTYSHWVARKRIIQDNVISGYGSHSTGIVDTFNDMSELPDIINREIIAWELIR